MSTSGWYPQPDGNERYFDGNDWTEHLRAPQAMSAQGSYVPPAKKSGMVKWIVLAVIGVVVLCCCGGLALAVGSAGDSESSGQGSEQTVEATPDVKVDAGELIEEFEDNELAGDQKYKGKTIEVTGVVEEIDTELFNEDKYLLDITDGGDFEILSVTCHDMDNDVLSELSVGDDITVIGNFEDGGDLGVDLEKCRVV